METTAEGRFDAFLAACAAATWPEPLWQAALTYFQGEGFANLSYHHLPPLGAPDEGKIRIVAFGFPDGWVPKYIKQKLFRWDPIAAHAASTEEPFRWSEIRKLRTLSPAEEGFLTSLAEAEVGEGLAIQVFGPGGRDGYVGLGFSDPDQSPTPGLVRKYQAACQVAHLRYCRIQRDGMPLPPALSERERELLHWVARGKSNGVIADIMDISPHTVDAYLRRVFLKLGTSDRISTALRALGDNLIRGY